MKKNEVLNRIFLAEMCFSQMKSYGSNGDFYEKYKNTRNPDFSNFEPNIFG